MSARLEVTAPALPGRVLVGNHLIDSLPAPDALRLQKLCEPVELVLSEVLCEPGDETRHVYFPVDAFVSLLALAPGCPGLEVGMIGHEGMMGAQLLLGVTVAPFRALVQGSGAALRISTPAFLRHLAGSNMLRQALGRYVHVLMTQLGTSAICVRFHQIGPRLARWLLMTQDRAGGDSFLMTQEFLGSMLGVRRVGVTNAASAMQKDGLIAYSRGTLTVLDRPGLESASCSCYAADRATYASQF